MRIFYCLILISLLSLTSCQEEVETVNMRVNHFKQTGTGEGAQMVFLVQEPDQFVTDEWHFFYSEFEGFDYEWGYVYELKIEKIPVDNPPADGSSIAYKLREIVARNQVQPEVTFEIQLKSKIRGIQELELRTSDSTFLFFNQVTILCEPFCDELASAFEEEDNITGVFTHVDPKSIALVDLIFEE